MRRPFVLAAAVALLCAGCATADAEDKSASASPAPDPGSVVRAAVAGTRAGTARIDETIELGAAGDEYRFGIAGGFDFGADRGHLTVDPPWGAASTDEVFTDGKVFARGSAGIAASTWASVSREKAEAHYLLRAPLNDPQHVMRQVAAMRQVSDEGSETVHGVRARHYRGTLDHRTLTLRMAADVRKQLGDARQRLGADLPVFADAWVDARGRLVKTRLAVNLGGVEATATMNLTDLGKPVRVTVPDPADTVPGELVKSPVAG
ncbi:hypothetical protein ACFV1A_08645 [Streptomyces seoulensis]|uniref:LppX_LprAFG lipoprotein n=1 Tax=Streptomyces seoulensis TaxID=73044 RepID=A0A4P6TUD9_STRSO|nr:hypothetical protein [Streptomyces seoulensis]QBJ90437.1 hypothetical protein D0Z67_09030 [Streptomyces seoulensis]